MRACGESRGDHGRTSVAQRGTREEGDDQWSHSVIGTQRRGRERVRALGCCASLAGPGGERLAGPSVSAGGNGPCAWCGLRAREKGRGIADWAGKLSWVGFVFGMGWVFLFLVLPISIFFSFSNSTQT